MQQGVDRLDNGAYIRFRASAPDAHPAGLLGQLLGQMERHHQDGNLRKELSDSPGDIEPIYIGHLEIQKDHIGRILLHPL
jgi:hypothetical protein